MDWIPAKAVKGVIQTGEDKLGSGGAGMRALVQIMETRPSHDGSLPTAYQLTAHAEAVWAKPVGPLPG